MARPLAGTFGYHKRARPGLSNRWPPIAVRAGGPADPPRRRSAASTAGVWDVTRPPEQADLHRAEQTATDQVGVQDLSTSGSTRWQARRTSWNCDGARLTWRTGRASRGFDCAATTGAQAATFANYDSARFRAPGGL